jgi:hypothetical protein
MRLYAPIGAKAALHSRLTCSLAESMPSPRLSTFPQSSARSPHAYDHVGRDIRDIFCDAAIKFGFDPIHEGGRDLWAPNKPTYGDMNHFRKRCNAFSSFCVNLLK